MELTHFSLFTGIGGIDLAAEWAGFETVGMCEIDEYCRKVLDKHWPDVPKWRDIFELTGEEIINRCGEISLISGGFPCQPFSAAGKRKGQADERYLWPEMLRIVREVKPRWFLGENVRGLLSSRYNEPDGTRGTIFGDILRDMAESGYRVGWLCYGAGDVGAPHKRERVFIVAYSESKRNNGNRTNRTDGKSEQVQFGGGSSKGNMADTDQQGMEGCEVAGEVERSRPERNKQPLRQSKNTTEGSAQPSLGSMVDEFSTKVDGGVNNANAKEGEPCKILHGVWRTYGTQEVQRNPGEQPCVQPQEVLQSSVRREQQEAQEPFNSCNPQTVCPPIGGCLRNVRGNGKSGLASHRQQSCQQQTIEPHDFMRLMSYEMALEEWEKTIQETICLRSLWQSCKEIGYVPNALSEIKESWQSLSDEEKIWIAFRACGRTAWPAGPGEQHEWELPRIATGVKDRVARLKALGNAVVPQQVYPILKAIAEIEGVE